jgi:tetrapyrrole methylase family protein / MazG family protein
MQIKDLRQTIFESLTPEQTKQIEEFCKQMELAVGLVMRLRGPNGCPWDREQDHLTLRPYLIEEAYEALDVLDRFQDGKFSDADQKFLREELGDVLLQVLLHSQIAEERGDFSVGDVAEKLAAKLVSRHPHVFGDAKANDAEEVLQNWEQLKKKEGKKGMLDGLPKNLPSLQRAARIGEKANRVGFDWKDWQGSWTKVEEELRELREAIDHKNPKEMEHELGDMFFALCNLARHLKIQPEDAHRKAIARFEGRFSEMEKIFESQGKDMHTATLEELDQVWDRVKSQERV